MSEKIAGQTMSKERVEKLRASIEEKSLTEHQLEAAKFAEDIMKFLMSQWGEMGFTREQGAFSVALATINLRETFPDGKDAFDAIAAAAREYYDRNA